MVVVATTYPDTFGIGQGSALAGLALTYSVQISGILQAMIRFFIQTETYFTSAERVREYAEISKLEKPAIVDGNRPLENWPNNGNIRFENVSMRYREDLPLVLREVDIIIKAKEKIGIVGRTGSGKSSLGIALFRLMELSEGRICIDGFDTSEIGLEDLRKKMTIIPQDPVLFVGSIRYNLDPFQQHSDEEIWKAVERSHIKELINRLPQKLENEVVENGENFSVGERQLLCMARAILRHSKIIVLDEATAAIDSETDSLVQDTIREAFADCTVLTIAHRLNTILNCNKIIVMQDGQVAEFGETQELMKNGQSKFSHLLAAGLKSGEEIVAAKSTNIHNKNNSNNTTACYINPSYTSTS
uniref:Multidrug resistance-associated protein 5-like n=1 Tax=Phallusia mammillata TaxID=59560 RepID=A0A6F9D6C3_9ASCI|nr:multidrug resistance-associated protein 5-like [Phallusia mammillata]